MASLPTSGKAIQISRNGGVEVLEYTDVPVPALVEGKVLVKNHFSGVNYIDTYFRTGLYPAPHFPLVLGREGAGEVVAAHDSVSGAFAQPGTRVVFLSGNDTASYAQYSVIPASKLIAIPEGVSTDVAAAAYLQGLTALTLIREAGNVQPGQWTFVHAAAGGVGGLLVQLLKATGAKVIATASTDEKLALAKKYGADYTIKSDEDIVSKVKEITGGHGIDAIFDGVGKATFETDMEIAAFKGRVLSFGNASGAVPPVNILRLGAKNLSLHRPVLNPYIEERQDLERYTTELFELIKSNKLKVGIHKVYELADAASAHTDIESRKTTGKLLIKTN
ncbi:hypothetical protein S7711_02761 [Stachybotrys chartarum IBT 7711]|uniref:Probable quinone oxidoreductase n=1 Tax=Stachybotrys chartarum (strain CBS 109288 / IBT 7711) TaxID=1280523 RepID=A0A084ALW9_STACB|nr:hypothetical protein S7711_02761 [Stachybotrys chartarum IBT 7711]